MDINALSINDQLHLQSLCRRQSPFACLMPAAAPLVWCLIYLQRRGIALDIISRCIRDGILYETKKYYNCIFVGRSLDGLARFSCLRSTSSRFRIDEEESDKRYKFHVIAINPYSVFLVVAESPIDALSVATLLNLQKTIGRSAIIFP